MRMLALVLLAGCFDPSPKPGQVCTDWCPPPETCVANVCRVIADEEHRANYMFLTDDARPISSQSASSLDAWCNERATFGGLPGTYVAWFSTAVSAASKFGSLQNTTRGWIRPDGLPFADTVQDIIEGRLYYPPRISDARTDMRAREDAVVATGTGGDGMARDTCSGLVAPDPESFVTVGRVDGGLQSWTYVGEAKCGAAAHIYCFAKDRSVPVAKPEVPAGAKHVFLTRNPYTLSSPADADIKCRNEAGGGTYVALLATAAQSVKERFAMSIGPWYRVDGVVASADMTELSAPIEVTFDGTHMTVPVWFGASSLTAKADATASCTNWTEPGGQASTGQSDRSVGAAPFSAQPGGCGSQYHYYCAER